MFKRSSVQPSNEDEFINIDERLAPYGDGGGDLSPEWQERFVAAPAGVAALLAGPLAAR